ncbi:MAG TPA: hypothetical protein VK455_06760 [Thermoplasmata archaeon]|nr:hypothetical protein [Thermoplasmata archaeon]
MLGGQLVDQGAGEGMETGVDAIALPSVVGLLSRQMPATPDVTGLDGTDLRKRYSDIVRPLGSHTHPVEGRFVRVKGD